MRRKTIMAGGLALLLLLTFSSCNVFDALFGPPPVDGQDGISIRWRGSLPSAPSDPQLNDAYYNTSDGTSYIWNGSVWDVLAMDGLDGADGQDGENPYDNLPFAKVEGTFSFYDDGVFVENAMLRRYYVLLDDDTNPANGAVAVSTGTTPDFIGLYEFFTPSDRVYLYYEFFNVPPGEYFVYAYIDDSSDSLPQVGQDAPGPPIDGGGLPLSDLASTGLADTVVSDAGFAGEYIGFFGTFSEADLENIFFGPRDPNSELIAPAGANITVSGPGLTVLEDFKLISNFTLPQN